jgi:hypothetical protein
MIQKVWHLLREALLQKGTNSLPHLSRRTCKRAGNLSPDAGPQPPAPLRRPGFQGPGRSPPSFGTPGPRKSLGRLAPNGTLRDQGRDPVKPPLAASPWHVSPRSVLVACLCHSLGARTDPTRYQRATPTVDARAGCCLFRVPCSRLQLVHWRTCHRATRLVVVPFCRVASCSVLHSTSALHCLHMRCAC